jgi:uncharacterized protein (DUF1800 family)
MKVTRRQALGLAAGGAAAVAATGCSSLLSAASGPAPHLSPPLPQQSPDIAAITRFGYGPHASRPQEVIKDGREKWFQDQLEAPEDDPLPVTLKLRRLDIFHFTAYELRDLPQPEIIRQLQSAALIRAVESPWQLRERMVDFWTNHFNIFARKGLAAYRKPQDDREVIRANALGSFPEMLLASARSTAMLLYLDQQASSFVQPNENYARELLELHSLGVDAGYTQKDVMEVARCFTGWTEERAFLRGRGQFKFREDLHDDGPKTVLGHSIPAGGGVKDGEKVIEIVASHPATASHLARKLCRFFLGREDSEVTVPVAEAFRTSKGMVRPMLKAVFTLAEQGKTEPNVKRPFDFCVSALRAIGAETDGGAEIHKRLAAMGQPLYQWPMPDGFPVDALSWTGSMVARWNFASDLAHGRIKGAVASPDRWKDLSPEALAASIMGVAADSSAAKNLAERLAPGESPAQLAALCLAAPEFQWRA